MDKSRRPGYNHARHLAKSDDDGLPVATTQYTVCCLGSRLCSRRGGADEIGAPTRLQLSDIQLSNMIDQDTCDKQRLLPISFPPDSVIKVEPVSQTPTLL